MFLAALLHFRVITDHLLLIPILNSHRLDEIENLGLQRIKTRIMADSKTYADMLPMMKSTNSSEALFSMASQTVTTSYQKGVSDTAWSVPEHLTLDEDLIVYGCRLLIPSKMRQKMLAHLHESPQGLVHTKQQAQLTIYWPGIDNNIYNVILACKKCQDCLPSNTKDLITSKPKPNHPFQEIVSGFCS